eukprot:gene13615-biopygen10898
MTYPMAYRYGLLSMRDDDLLPLTAYPTRNRFHASLNGGVPVTNDGKMNYNDDIGFDDNIDVDTDRYQDDNDGAAFFDPATTKSKPARRNNTTTTTAAAAAKKRKLDDSDVDAAAHRRDNNSTTDEDPEMLQLLQKKLSDTANMRLTRFKHLDDEMNLTELPFDSDADADDDDADVDDQTGKRAIEIDKNTPSVKISEQEYNCLKDNYQNCTSSATLLNNSTRMETTTSPVHQIQTGAQTVPSSSLPPVRPESNLGSRPTRHVRVRKSQPTRALSAHRRRPVHEETVRGAVQAKKSKRRAQRIPRHLRTSDHVRPRIIYSDNGKEFLNSAVSHYLESIRIRHVTTNDSSIKGAIVERANQTLKRKLVKIASLHDGKYLEHLQNIVLGLNNSVHTTTRLAPNAVDPVTVNTARINIEKSIVRRQKKHALWDKRAHRPLLHVGDWVRIRKENKTFRRGFQQGFTDELFQVTDVDTHDLPPVYKLQDLRQEPVIGTFQYPELVHVTFPASFKITKSRLRQQTVVDPDTGARTRWVQIRIAEYWDSLWLPEQETGLGQHVDKTYFTAVSSGDPDHNILSQSDTFANRPYGDVQFDPRFTWNTALTNASLTHTSTLDVPSKLWYKRFYLPEKLSSTAGSAFEKVYKSLTTQKWLHHQNYARVLDATPRVQPHPSVAYRLVHQHQIAYPTELESFLTLCYTDYLRPYKEYYDTFADGKAPVKTSSMFGIKKNTNATVVHDCFDIVVRRSNAADSSTDRFARNTSFALSEGSYQQIVRLSRSLADLLNIDSWEWRESADFFPYRPGPQQQPQTI